MLSKQVVEILGERLEDRLAEMFCERFDDMRQPFSNPAKHGVFLEIGAMAEEDAYPDATGNIPIELKVEELFSEYQSVIIIPPE